MRIYGTIQTRFWTHPDIQDLSDQAKLLAAYLLSSPHTNMLGCFRIPIGYIAEDLKWSYEKVKQAFDELISIQFINRDDTSAWIIIHNFLKYHPIENPNQAKSAESLFDEIPDDLIFISELFKKILDHGGGKHLKEGFRNRFERVSEGFLNQEQDIEQEQDISSLREDVISIADNITQCPHEKIIHLYHETLPMCPPVRVWNKTRRGYLKQRWKENQKHQTLDWWKQYFEHIKQSDFLIGKSAGREDKPPFLADLEWLVRPNNFAKVIEGKYHGARI